MASAPPPGPGTSEVIRATPAAEAAKKELDQCEKEISTIKSAIRTVGPESAPGGSESSSTATNALSVVLLKVDGLPEAAKPRLQLQLSSPVEELELSEVWSGADDEAATAAESTSSKAVFGGVETKQAMLTVTAFDADIPLGTSESLSVEAWCRFDALDLDTTECTTEVAVPIRPADAATTSTDAAAEKPAVAEPTCTLTLRVTFRMSSKERREALYEVLQEATKRRSQAIEKLRKAALEANRQQMAAAGPPKTSKPAVKPGFLNKPPKKQVSKIQRFYDKYLGPQSILRRVVPVAKDYVIFFGFALFIHYKGHMLSLPPPV